MQPEPRFRLLRDRTMRPRTIDWQRALFIPLTILAWLAVVVIGGWLLSHVAKTILTLVLSAIVAFALTPVVSLLSRWLPRGLAIAIAYIVGFAIVLGLGAVIVMTAAAQVTNLVNHLPVYAHEVQKLEPRLVTMFGRFGLTQAKIHNVQQQLLSYLQGAGTRTAQDSLGIITGIVSTLVDVVLVLILSVYLTANGPNIARRLRRETPSAQRPHTDLLIGIVNQVVGGYIRGTLTLAALIGLLVGFGMWFLHVPYAILLGLLAFFMEFIPIVGVLISGSVCVLIALFQGWITALLVLGYFVLVHVIEGDVVGPRIMSRAVGIHPATALVALVAGTELFGVWGTLFAAPLAGLVQAIVVATLLELRGGNPQAVLRAATEATAKQSEETAERVAKNNQVSQEEAEEEEGQPTGAK
jgi:predicted PurR-regulated permease PerM